MAADVALTDPYMPIDDHDRDEEMRALLVECARDETTASAADDEMNAMLLECAARMTIYKREDSDDDDAMRAKIEYDGEDDGATGVRDVAVTADMEDGKEDDAEVGLCERWRTNAVCDDERISRAVTDDWGCAEDDANVRYADECCLLEMACAEWPEVSTARSSNWSGDTAEVSDARCDVDKAGVRDETGDTSSKSNDDKTYVRDKTGDTWHNRGKPWSGTTWTWQEADASQTQSQFDFELQRKRI
jgi:hypothetical protein